MKYKTTQKEVISGYPIVLKIPYCEMQYLLKYETPVAYTCSKSYGWRADIYELEKNIALTTGYAPFGNVDIPKHIRNKYEEQACKICSQNKDDRNLLRMLINNMLKEVNVI